MFYHLPPLLCHSGSIHCWHTTMSILLQHMHAHYDNNCPTMFNGIKFQMCLSWFCENHCIPKHTLQRAFMGFGWTPSNNKKNEKTILSIFVNLCFWKCCIFHIHGHMSYTTCHLYIECPVLFAMDGTCMRFKLLFLQVLVIVILRGRASLAYNLHIVSNLIIVCFVSWIYSFN